MAPNLNFKMSLRKKASEKAEKGLPQRKSMAGPTMLGTFTAPGAIRKSIAVDSSLRKQESGAQLVMPTIAPEVDYSKEEGRIRIISKMYSFLLNWQIN